MNFLKSKIVVVPFLVLLALTSTCKKLSQPEKTDAATLRDAVPDVEFTKVAKNTWLHTSYEVVNGYGLVYSHGGIIKIGEKIVVVDSAWTTNQTEKIISWVQENLKGRVVAAIVTHFHRDKMGGIQAFIDEGIPTYASRDTNSLAQKKGQAPAEFDLAMVSNALSWEGGGVEIFYPGPGHTHDNLVVYSTSDDVLLGGCIIRPGKSKTMGNTADANLVEWPHSIKRLQERYDKAITVVPSHGKPGGLELLEHTYQLSIGNL